MSFRETPNRTESLKAKVEKYRKETGRSITQMVLSGSPAEREKKLSDPLREGFEKGLHGLIDKTALRLFKTRLSSEQKWNLLLKWSKDQEFIKCLSSHGLKAEEFILDCIGTNIFLKEELLKSPLAKILSETTKFLIKNDLAQAHAATDHFLMQMSLPRVHKTDSLNPSPALGKSFSP